MGFCSRFFRPTVIHKNNETNPESSISCIRKWLILGLKAEKHVRNINHTEDWELGCHPRDNAHVTH